MLILSSQASASSTLFNNQDLLVTPLVAISEEHLVTSPSVNFSYQQGHLNVETTSPAFVESSHQYLQFSDITVTGNNGLAIQDDFTLKGINVSYEKSTLRLELALLSNNSLVMPQEKIFIQGLLNIWTLENFNLSIKGRIEASRTGIYTANFISGAIIPVEQEKFNKSLSVVSSYVLNDHWAVTGTVMKRDLNQEFKKRVNYKKDSDNIAIIGTIYSF
jgi:hypothetical protein